MRASRRSRTKALETIARPQSWLPSSNVPTPSTGSRGPPPDDPRRPAVRPPARHDRRLPLDTVIRLARMPTACRMPSPTAFHPKSSLTTHLRSRPLPRSPSSPPISPIPSPSRRPLRSAREHLSPPLRISKRSVPALRHGGRECGRSKPRLSRVPRAASRRRRGRFLLQSGPVSLLSPSLPRRLWVLAPRPRTTSFSPFDLAVQIM